MVWFESLMGLIALVAAIWVIYEVLAKNKKLSSTEKIVWIVCAILFSIITAIVYFFIGKKK